MAKKMIEETTLTAIGDAIREKAGTTDLIDPAAMADAITNLPSGGGDSFEIATAWISVSDNCYYDLSNYCNSPDDIIMLSYRAYIYYNSYGLQSMLYLPPFCQPDVTYWKGALNIQSNNSTYSGYSSFFSSSSSSKNGVVGYYSDSNAFYPICGLNSTLMRFYVCIEQRIENTSSSTGSNMNSYGCYPDGMALLVYKKRG